MKVIYEFESIRQTWRKDDLKASVPSMWRYAPVLPADVEEAVTLAEGWTPLLRARRLERELSAPEIWSHEIWLKDESRNPTGSTEARRFSLVATAAKRHGWTKLAMASAGGPAGALAAYAAAAGFEAQIFMPRDAPQSTFIECKALGAEVRLVEGGTEDCARLVAEQVRSGSAVDAASLDEVFGGEGAKTIAFEIAEQLDWQLSGVIVYVPYEASQAAIEKGFEELEQLSWIDGLPKVIAAKSVGAPNEDIMDAALLLARCEGIFPASEAGACVALLREMLRRMLKDGKAPPKMRIIIVNPGSGLKHTEAYSTRYSRQGASEQDKLGGLITPR